MDQKMIEMGARTLLIGLGVNLEDPNFKTTPHRMFKVYQEMFAPPDTEWPVFDEEYTDIVVMRGHVFWTLCPHHMLPVKITASVAYLPQGKVIGASKLVRAMHDVNTQPMTQEKLTDLVLKRIENLTSETSRGVAVMMEGRHGCFEIRGAKSCATMRTLKFSGEFLEGEMQSRFMELIR